MDTNSSFSCLLKETEHNINKIQFPNPLEKHSLSLTLPKPNSFTQIINEESSLNHQIFSDKTLMDDAWVAKNLILLSNILGKNVFSPQNQNVSKLLKYSGKKS